MEGINIVFKNKEGETKKVFLSKEEIWDKVIDMAQSWCGKHKNKENSNIELKQFYCVVKEHYPELVGDGVCDKQCTKCKKLKQ